jgi:hypothetical protein
MGHSQRPLRVKGGGGRQADGTAGLPPAPEIAGAFRRLRFVPLNDMTARNLSQSVAEVFRRAKISLG